MNIYFKESAFGNFCLVVYPSKHIEEIKFIETQQDIKWKK
jgi:hypothetical protein